MAHLRENGAAIVAGLLLAGLLSGGCILFQPYVRDLKLSSIEPVHDRQAVRPHGTGPLLRFFFTTSRDLADLDSPGASRMDVGLCPSAEESRLYVQGPYIDANRYPAKVDEDVPPPSSYEYEARFVYDPGLLFDEPQKAAGATPDLCFKVSAASYFGAGGFDSRPAVIPGTAIDAALAEATSAGKK